MAVNGDYAQPVYVNGYQCINCTQVAEAKRDIDPAHPKSGPGGIDAQFDPTRNQAVVFGGVLAGVASAQPSSGQQTSQTASGFGAQQQIQPAPPPSNPGGLLNISV
jgi:hypothetical protein